MMKVGGFTIIISVMMNVGESLSSVQSNGWELYQHNHHRRGEGWLINLRHESNERRGSYITFVNITKLTYLWVVFIMLMHVFVLNVMKLPCIVKTIERRLRCKNDEDTRQV